MQVRQRDPVAWRKIVHVYGPLVYRWCRSAGVPEHAAADIGQEVFRAIADGLQKFRRENAGDTFVGWMRQITRYKIVDYQRKVMKEPTAGGGSTFQDFLGAVPDRIPKGQSGESTACLLDAERRLLVNRAMELLQRDFKPRTWRAFWATAVEGRATNDVAADLDMTTMAIRKAKSRVLHRLRQEFGELLSTES